MYQNFVKRGNNYSTLHRDHVKQVSYRWLENCEWSLRHNISTTGRLQHIPLLISIVGGIKTTAMYLHGVFEPVVQFLGSLSNMYL